MFVWSQGTREGEAGGTQLKGKKGDSPSSCGTQNGAEEIPCEEKKKNPPQKVGEIKGTARNHRGHMKQIIGGENIGKKKTRGAGKLWKVWKKRFKRENFGKIGGVVLEENGEKETDL